MRNDGVIVKTVNMCDHGDTIFSSDGGKSIKNFEVVVGRDGKIDTSRMREGTKVLVKVLSWPDPVEVLVDRNTGLKSIPWLDTAPVEKPCHLFDFNCILFVNVAWFLVILEPFAFPEGRQFS